MHSLKLLIKTQTIEYESDLVLCQNQLQHGIFYEQLVDPKPLHDRSN